MLWPSPASPHKQYQEHNPHSLLLALPQAPPGSRLDLIRRRMYAVDAPRSLYVYLVRWVATIADCLFAAIFTFHPSLSSCSSSRSFLMSVMRLITILRSINKSGEAHTPPYFLIHRTIPGEWPIYPPRRQDRKSVVEGKSVD